MAFESLPVELIADILGELDLESLIKISYLSRRLHHISSDSSLNPWRRPILRNLYSSSYEPCLANLSVRSTVPRRNWVEILSIAHPSFILFEATLPNIQESEWEESFRRRFIPGWSKRRKDGKWKEVFLKVLHRVWHRSNTSCTTDEAWTKYIVLNRNGSVNELDSSSRGYNPLAIFHEMKLQSNLAHLETRVRLVVEFTDARVLAFGVLNAPRSTFSINPNARAFLHPPGIEISDTTVPTGRTGETDQYGRPLQGSGEGNSASSTSMSAQFPAPPTTYQRLTHPLPCASHINYPFYTPGGGDTRWLGSGELEEGLKWVGGLMITVQLVGPHTHGASGEGTWTPPQDLDLVVGPGRHQYASFSWPDLIAIAPWMEHRISKLIRGPGLGN